MRIVASEMPRRTFLGAAALASLGLAACSSSSQAAGDGNAVQDLSAVQSAADNGDSTLRVGSEISFPPYEWLTDTQTEFTAPVDGGGYADGFDVTLAKRIAEALDKDLLFVNMPFGDLVDALNIGTVDILLSGLADTEDRAQVVAFSHSYFDSVYGLMVKADGPFAAAKELADFSGAAVLGQKNSPLDTIIDQIPDANHLVPAEHVPDMLKSLEADTCDAVTVAVETAETYITMYPDLMLIVPENPRFDPGFSGTCVALRKDDVATLEVVNQVIDGLGKDELQLLYEEAEARQPKDD